MMGCGPDNGRKHLMLRSFGGMYVSPAVSNSEPIILPYCMRTPTTDVDFYQQLCTTTPYITRPIVVIITNSLRSKVMLRN